jgi:metal-responsive CopG/Arc/MetJ family transcriptional regulator
MTSDDSKHDKQPISLRVPQSELEKWDEAVENDEYKDRTKLIRRATNMEVSDGFDKQSELESVDVDLTPVENRLQSLENRFHDVEELLGDLNTVIAHLVNSEGKTIDIRSEVYEALPKFESQREAKNAIDEVAFEMENPDGLRSAEYGWVQDIQAKYMGYSDHDVTNTLNTLISDIDSVNQYSKHDKRFIFEVKNE